MEKKKVEIKPKTVSVSAKIQILASMGSKEGK